MVTTIRRAACALALCVLGCGGSNDSVGEDAGGAPDTEPASDAPIDTEADARVGDGAADLAALDSDPVDEGGSLPDGVAYFNDFSTEADGHRLDQFVAYRDPFVVNHTVGRSDHAPTGGVNCTAPEETREQTRELPYRHVYQCLPGGDSDLGHMMAFAMDTSGYGFAGALPDQVFEGVTEVSVDINTTNAGGRNFIEIKVIPADNVYVNAMPCIPDLPCNDGWDYNDIGAVGASTDSQEGTGLTIARPSAPDGIRFDAWNREVRPDGDGEFPLCPSEGFCQTAYVHEETLGIRARYQHIFRDNGDGTLSFGIERADGGFDWVSTEGSFPSGPVRVVVAFHNYTGTKDGQGPGMGGNLSPSAGGFTWHWDELLVRATSAQPSIEYFDGTHADRIVTPNDCISFAQGQRTLVGNTDILPRFLCEDDGPLEF
ncbi:MAG: hypothetical protein AAF645_10805 [Myxococcota bacterium]